MSERKNVFVVGMEDFYGGLLETLPDADRYEFHSLLGYDQVADSQSYPIEAYLEEARRKIDAVPGGADAIIGYWDFPTCTLLPILREYGGHQTPSLESILTCEHKTWCRRAQRDLVPEETPRVSTFNPFADDPAAEIEMDYPFWIKPVTAHSSFLGFKICERGDLDEALPIIRRKIGRFGEPLNAIMEHADLPDDIRPIDGHHCIAEEIISAGQQCTVEGFEWDGEVEIYGVVDSIRSGRHGSTFSRYQYPSQLPRHVCERAVEAAKRFIRHIGYRRGPFNIEFFWDEESDRITMLEINSRISKSHSPMFLMVDGVTHQKVPLDLALGRRPEMPKGEGPHRFAAKFMLRSFEEDGIVRRVPGPDDIARVTERFSEARVNVLVEEGVRLSDLLNQESYSYELAELYLGADSPEKLEQRHEACIEMLPFEIEETARPR